jgi:hypothetical protein
VNVTRKQIRHALDAYIRQVEITGRSTNLEQDLFVALQGLAADRVIFSADEEALKARLEKVETMLEEVAALDSEEEYVTFTIDDLVRHNDGTVATIYGTRDEWRYVNGSIAGDSWWERVKQSPYIIGDPAPIHPVNREEEPLILAMDPEHHAERYTPDLLPPGVAEASAGVVTDPETGTLVGDGDAPTLGELAEMMRRWRSLGVTPQSVDYVRHQVWRES